MAEEQHPLDSVQAIENRLRAMGLAPVLDRGYLQRLKDIRLLGTMEYVVKLQRSYSRYEHSLAVAELSRTIAEALALSDRSITLIVLASLLHDIGHTALSHGAEVFLRKRLGRFHQGDARRLASEFSRDMRSEGQPELASQIAMARDLLAGALAPSRAGRADSALMPPGDEVAVLNLLVNGTLSVDALEGVTRTARSVGLPYPEPVALAQAFRKVGPNLLLDAGSDTEALVRDFFELERRIYEGFIYSPRGMAAEAMLTRALELAFPGPGDVSSPSESDPTLRLGSTKVFLRMTDTQVYRRIAGHETARHILNQLETGTLFVSASESAPLVHLSLTARLSGGRPRRESSQHGEGNSVANGDASSGRVARHQSAQLQSRYLEEILARDLGVPPALVIIHSAIRKSFRFAQPPTRDLFGSISLDDIARSYKASRRYEPFADVFVPPSVAPRLRTVSIPALPSTSPADSMASDGESLFASAAAKIRGAVATPTGIVRFLVSWAVRNRSDAVLDPASGDGEFLREACDRLSSLGAGRDAIGQHVYGVEMDALAWRQFAELWRGRQRLPANHMVRDDFFSVSPGDVGPSHGIDAVVGNPPYVRAHRFKGADRARALEAANKVLNATLGPDARLSPSASSWAPYLLHATAFLRPQGRLAMVLPTELLTADYAEPVRRFLRKRFRSLSFVLFEGRVFEKQQDVLLLLASASDAAGMRRTEVRGADDLAGSLERASAAPEARQGWQATKWTALLTSQDVLDLLESLIERGLALPFASVANVGIGLVTGDVKFYTLAPSAARARGIRRGWLKPVLTSASHVAGAVFSREDLARLRKADAQHLLLRVPPDADIAADEELARYLDEGHRMGVHLRYKCRTRWPWYSVPYPPSPDAFLTYMSGRRCRMTMNEAKVNSTNTLHHVSFTTHRDLVKPYLASFYSSLTGLSLELVGRGYGGGLLKLEPRDARAAILPNLEKFPQRVVDRISAKLARLDKALRKPGAHPNVWSELDGLVLREGLGLSRSEVALIQEECARLQQRRMSRSSANGSK